MGLPPSGGFAAKWLMLRASVASGQWPWAIVMLAGGLLAAGYVYRILAPALKDEAIALKAPPQRGREAIALALAIVAVALGFAPQSFFDFLANRPAGGRGGASMIGVLGPWLLAATLAVPLLFLAACLSGRLRNEALALQWLAPVPALGAAILAIGWGPFAVDWPALRVGIRLDLPSALVLAVVSLLWIVVSAATFSGEGTRPNERFAVSWLLTMAGSLGVFLAADLLTFYLVYALVSIPAYELIIRDGAPRSRRAGARLHGLYDSRRGDFAYGLRPARGGRTPRQSADR